MVLRWPQDGPISSQKGTKIKIHIDGPKRRQNGSEMVQDGPRCLKHFQFLANRGAPPKLSTKQEPTMKETNTSCRSQTFWGSLNDPRGSKRAQEPKRAPRELQKTPRSRKRTPRQPQDSPKTVQESSREPKRTSRGPQESPKRPPR